MNQTPVALQPVGPFAQPLTDLSWMLIAVMAAVLGLVVAATLLALFGRTRLRGKLGQPWLVLVGGLAFPTLVVAGLLAWSISVTDKVASKAETGDVRIRVTGEMWWWRVHYLDGERILFETANEIRIPVGRTVAFELASNDVIHSFWIPRLGGKMDMIPGRTNVLRLQADTPGVYRGQCYEFCGAAHALMAMEVIAETPEAYASWTDRQARPSSASGDGLEIFAGSGCGACHSIRGTNANGRMGPDLTHLASRQKIAAGILPNDSATLRRFISHPDDLKPGIRMPDYTRLSEQDVTALAAWLETLR